MPHQSIYYIKSSLQKCQRVFNGASACINVESKYVFDMFKLLYYKSNDLKKKDSLL